MGIYIKTKCVCGAVNVSVDALDHDYDMREWGTTCSDACRSIWNTRVSVCADYDYDYQMGVFGVSLPLPLYRNV